MCYTAPPQKLRGLKAKSYSNYEDIITAIDKAPKDEKWLIQVTSKEKGIWLQAKVKGSRFIFSENGSDNYVMTDDSQKEKVNINKENLFECRVLISTTILDCGTSLYDPALKHIVLSTYDPVATVQFVGRKRFAKTGKDTVTLYFEDKPIGEVIRIHCMHVFELLQRIKRFAYETSGARDGHDKEIADMLERGLMYYDNGKLVVNKLGVIKLENIGQYLAHILQDAIRHDDEHEFLKHQLELFGFSPNECDSLGFTGKENKAIRVEKFLEPYAGRALDETEYKDIIGKLDSILIEEFGADTIGAKRNENSVRKPNTYNSRFQKYHIRYMVYQDGDSYIFKSTNESVV